MWVLIVQNSKTLPRTLCHLGIKTQKSRQLKNCSLPSRSQRKVSYLKSKIGRKKLSLWLQTNEFLNDVKRAKVFSLCNYLENQAHFSPRPQLWFLASRFQWNILHMQKKIRLSKHLSETCIIILIAGKIQYLLLVFFYLHNRTFHRKHPFDGFHQHFNRNCHTCKEKLNGKQLNVIFASKSFLSENP